MRLFHLSRKFTEPASIFCSWHNSLQFLTLDKCERAFVMYAYKSTVLLQSSTVHSS